MALNELDAEKNVTVAPSNCNTSGALWETGKQLFEYIQKQTLADGTTGRVGFDEMGDRIYAEYQIVNMQRKRKVTVGYYNYSNVSAMIYIFYIKLWLAYISAYNQIYLFAMHLLLDICIWR